MAHHTTSHAALVRCFRALLRVLPGDLRRTFGDDMVRLLADQMREAHDSGQGPYRLWAAAVGDLMVQAGAEWASRARTGAGRLREEVGMGGWAQDLRGAARALARRPGFTALAGGTLALGMAAVVAMFSVVDGVLLRPLPYPEADRLAVVWKVNPTQGSRSPNVDHPDVLAWNQALGDALVVGYATSRPTLSGFGLPRVVHSAQVTGSILGVFGVAPVLGRDLSPADDVPDGPRVLVVGHGFWQDELGSDPGVLGRTLTLNGEPWEVVGVAPAGFAFPDGTELWTARRHPAEECGHGCNIMRAVARLPADPDARQTVQARLEAVDARLAEEAPGAHTDVVTEMEPLLDHLVAPVRQALWVLFAAVGMVLAIACANVANLLLVRAHERATETAVRATLGAGRWRLARQFLGEALLLTAASGVAALFLAWWALGLLPALAPDDLPRIHDVQVSLRTVVVSLGLVLLVTGTLSLLPLRSHDRDALQGGRRSVGRRRGQMSRAVLLGAEVALSISLLLGTGLLVRTLHAMQSVELGFQPEGVERFRLSVPESRYDVTAVLELFRQLDERLAALPGVRTVGHGFGVPFAAGSINTSATLPDRPETADDDLSADLRPSSPDYLQAMGMTLLDGRWFTPGDRRDAQPVAVLNEAAARAFFPGENPLGQRIALSFSWGFDDEPPRTVVGVVGDVRARSLTDEDPPAAYLPNEQVGMELAYFHMALEPGAPSALDAARALVADMDPELAITDQERVADAVARQTADTRFYLTLLSAFSFLALGLATVGLYGVVAYSVSRRRREIGVRRALGAQRHDVVRLVVRQGLGPAVAGMCVGLAASWATGRVMAALLYGVAPMDPWVMAVVAGLVLGVALLATALPARGASRIAPVEALRQE